MRNLILTLAAITLFGGCDQPDTYNTYNTYNYYESDDNVDTGYEPVEEEDVDEECAPSSVTVYQNGMSVTVIQDLCSQPIGPETKVLHLILKPDQNVTITHLPFYQFGTVDNVATGDWNHCHNFTQATFGLETDAPVENDRWNVWDYLNVSPCGPDASYSIMGTVSTDPLMPLEAGVPMHIYLTRDTRGAQAGDAVRMAFDAQDSWAQFIWWDENGDPESFVDWGNAPVVIPGERVELY